MMALLEMWMYPIFVILTKWSKDICFDIDTIIYHRGAVGYQGQVYVMDHIVVLTIIFCFLMYL